MTLNNNQIQLGAKWCTLDNLGYMGKVPKNERELYTAWNTYMSECDLDETEDVIEECESWKKNLRKKNNDSDVNLLKNDLPWLFD
jgi:hypothetical protein